MKPSNVRTIVLPICALLITFTTTMKQLSPFHSAMTDGARQTVSMSAASSEISAANTKYAISSHLRSLLPIVPRIASSSQALRHFFSNYTRNDRAGWIDANRLAFGAVQDLRTTAEAIMGRQTECAYPKVVSGNIPEGNDLEYCMWDKDIVSSAALADFSFETELWTWVTRVFSDLRTNHSSFINPPSVGIPLISGAWRPFLACTTWDIPCYLAVLLHEP